MTFVTVTLEDGLSLGWNLSGGGDGANVGGSAYASNTSHTYTACLVDDCYNVTMWDMNADGWNGGWIEVWMDNELVTTATMEDGFMTTMQLGINADCDDEDGIDRASGSTQLDLLHTNPTEGETTSMEVAGTSICLWTLKCVTLLVDWCTNAPLSPTTTTPNGCCARMRMKLACT